MPHENRAMTSNLSAMKDLYLVHPWIRPLLDQEFAHAAVGFGKTIRALRLVARLRQPFGSLLFEQVSRMKYKHAAPDSLIMVQFSEHVSLIKLIENICTIDVQEPRLQHLSWRSEITTRLVIVRNRGTGYRNCIFMALIFAAFTFLAHRTKVGDCPQ